MKREKWLEEIKEKLTVPNVTAVVKKAVATLCVVTMFLGTTFFFNGCSNEVDEPDHSDMGQNNNQNENNNQNQNQNENNNQNQNQNENNNNNQNQNGNENQNNQQDEINNQGQNNQNQQEEQKQQLIAEKTAVWNGWIEDLQEGNYKVEITSGENQFTYWFDQNIVKEVTGGQTTFFVFEDGTVTELVSVDGESFEAQESNVTSAESFFYNYVSEAVVVDVADNGSFTIKNDNKTFTASVDASGNMTLSSAEASAKVSEVHAVELVAPEVKQESNNIYEINENGEKVFNCALIGQVVENWLKGDNQYGEDFLSYQARNMPGMSYTEEELPVVKKVLYVKASEDYISVVLLSDQKSYGMYIMERNFRKADFYTQLKSGSLKTADDLSEYLNGTLDLNINKTMPITNIEYTTLDDDYAEHKEMFEILTDRVFDRIETVGMHSYINTVKENSILDGFSDGTILFAYKTKPTGETAGYGLGQYQNWSQNYLILKNGEYQWVQISVVSSTYAPIGVENCYTNVLADQKNTANAQNWLVVIVNTKDEIDATNLNLWNDPEKVEEKILEN